MTVLLLSLFASPLPHPLSDLDAFRAGIRTLAASGRITVPRGEGVAPDEYRFRLWYETGGRFRTEVEAGAFGRITTVSDGEFVWTKSERVAYRQPFETYRAHVAAGGAVDPLTDLLLDETPLAERFDLVGYDGRTWRLAPKDAAPYDVLVVRRDDLGAVAWIEAYLVNGPRRDPALVARVVFDRFVRNHPVSPARFRFDPEGSPIADVP